MTSLCQGLRCSGFRVVAELKTLSNMLVARACELKLDIFEKFEINISTRRIQTKLCTVKAYFTLIDFRRILKGLEDIQVFLDMKYRMFGRAVSKYTIVLVCVCYDGI